MERNTHGSQRLAQNKHPISQHMNIHESSKPVRWTGLSCCFLLRCLTYDACDEPRHGCGPGWKSHTHTHTANIPQVPDGMALYGPHGAVWPTPWANRPVSSGTKVTPATPRMSTPKGVCLQAADLCRVLTGPGAGRCQTDPTRPGAQAARHRH